MQKVDVNGNQARLSSTGIYFILDDDNSHLYVRAGELAPYYCTRSAGPSIPYSGVTYHQHRPVQKFLRDCLHTAEEIIWGQPLTLYQDRSKVGDDLFGASDDENIRIAESQRGKPNADQNASPGVSQAYAIVSTDKQSRYPYHAAGVLAVDGGDRVTVEVFAVATDAQQNERDELGNFEMYSMTVGQTFHDVWCGGPFTNPVTVVLEHV